MSSFIATASGGLFDPLAPTTDMVALYDIAAHLSKMARWTGATKGDDIYPVAQHSVLVSHLCHPDFALEGLHHDSSEAYLVDVARPLKYTPGFMEVYKHYEAQLTDVIYRALGIPFTGTMHPSVKEADDRMLATEARDIMPPMDAYWAKVGIDLTRAYDFRIDSIWTPKQAREAFLERHYFLVAREKARQDFNEIVRLHIG
jgi:uncharacterized protein